MPVLNTDLLRFVHAIRIYQPSTRARQYSLQHLSISLKPWRPDPFPTKFHLPYILVLHNGNIKEIHQDK
jgi:hypothetical protein